MDLKFQNFNERRDLDSALEELTGEGTSTTLVSG
jgi:hypothetical protein